MKTVKRRSQKQEKSVAKDFNARPTVASGALWGMKGDVRNDKFLIECKTTEKDYYSITAKVWEKIEKEALKDHMRIPLMIIDLKDRERIIVFRPQDFLENGMTDIKHLFKTIPKSFRISGDLLGYNEQGDYVSMFTTCICGEKENVICFMLYTDFYDQFKNILEGNKCVKTCTAL